MKSITTIIAEELSVKEEYVSNVLTMMAEGCTIPFIARYRKELHGSMDDTSLRKLEERAAYLKNLDERKETIRKAIEEQGKLTEEISKAIDEAMTLVVLEDIYRPYKQKRKTRASVAKEKGLEPLSVFLMIQGKDDPLKEAEKYIDDEKGVETAEDALQGAMDIIAESVSDDADHRAALRKHVQANAEFGSKAAKEEDSVYRQYYDFSQKLSRVKGYQILAINRGEKEGFLKVTVDPDHEKAKEILQKRVGIKNSPAEPYLKSACDDSYTRLIWPSLEREFRSKLTEMACDGAIDNFALNLKPLLMQPPVKGKVTMGLDPGYAHGCKVAVVDGTGKVLDTAVVYPTFSDAKKEAAIETLSKLIKKHQVEHIAIGNGTASRETESMTAEMLNRLHGGQSYAIVNEAGASVYSASKLGAEEFPEYDVNIRSAISIARRLQDPLAELVKIDPMSIGVGQYQHDMPAAQLEAALNGVVEDCVNSVGVDINSASPALLTRVSGLTNTTAKNIVKYREENGPFQSRKEILKVPKIGPKAFEQCAGFLRVPESRELLDNTGVHPESYAAAEKLLRLCEYSKEDVTAHKVSDIDKRIAQKGKKETAEACGIGVPTLLDMTSELKRPGRDPREDLPPVVLRKDVLDITDLKPGMKMK
ncbi:MAG: RNA-binding transcriptional accessory protein, partial [Parasporobacterium sp.]|nr:RNA-binding transcriptional accessory protein [Parasporobacterium sp.]